MKPVGSQEAIYAYKPTCMRKMNLAYKGCHIFIGIAISAD